MDLDHKSGPELVAPPSFTYSTPHHIIIRPFSSEGGSPAGIRRLQLSYINRAACALLCLHAV